MTGSENHALENWINVAYFSLSISLTLCQTDAEQSNVTSTNLKDFGRRRFWLIKNTSGVTWEEAQLYCLHQYNGRLAVLDEVDGMEHISAELSSQNEDNMSSWLGARSNDSLNDWRLVNGTIIPKGKGLFEESSEGGNCLILNQRFQKRKCSTKTGAYICDLPKTPSDNKCLLMNKDKYNPGEKCFILFNASDITWFAAREKCLKAGGDLASLFPDILSTPLTNVASIGGYKIPWWWMSNTVSGLEEVLYYNWTEGKESYTSNSCLSVTPSGWEPKQCSLTNIYFICEKTQSSENRTSPTPSQKNEEDSKTNLAFIIIGCLAAGILILVIVVVILVTCLRRAKIQKDSEEFQYRGSVSEGVRSIRESSVEVATVSGGIGSNYEYAQPVDVRHFDRPHEVHNDAYQDYEPDSSGYGSKPIPNVDPYSSRSIESIIERPGNGDARPSRDAHAQEPKGAALISLEKRLSLLMKREYDEGRDALPSATTTLRSGPDVVPMTSFNVYEDVDQSQGGGASGSRPDGVVYAEVRRL